MSSSIVILMMKPTRQEGTAAEALGCKQSGRNSLHDSDLPDPDAYRYRVRQPHPLASYLDRKRRQWSQATRIWPWTLTMDALPLAVLRHASIVR